jgi:hypothetical protein
MKKEYFVNLRPAAVVKHRIHEKKCPFNQNSVNMMSLGSFKSAGEALTEAEKLFHGVMPCPFCLKDFKERKVQKFSSGNRNNQVPASFSSITPTWESALFSSES